MDFNKKKLTALAISALAICISVESCAAPKKLEGFNWYSEKQILEQKKKEEESSKSKENAEDMKQQKEIPSYERNIKKLQEDHQKAHMQALDNPTRENLLEEIRLEREMMRKSRAYGERRVVAWMLDGGFDMENNPNILHRRLRDDADDKDILEKLKHLSKDWGLILQIKRGCPYCKSFAKIASEFANNYGFQLLSASDDGLEFEGIEGIPENGKLSALNPKNDAPTLYLIKSDGKEIIPISKGINNEIQIIKNIKAIDQHARRLFE
ncbi:conjugal transfer protein TraF [Rickettsiaceae bacterium]|nr:conjugal transfer protein TraF [Rickettsiaceae bacterium]